MLKRCLKLPQTKGSFRFWVDYHGALPEKGAIFVIRPNPGSASSGEEVKSSLSWSNAANGFYAYSPAVSEASRIFSRSFEIDFQSPFVELEVRAWGGNKIESIIEDFTLISLPSDHDAKFTTFVGGLND